MDVKVPYADQDPHEVRTLIQAMDSKNTKNKKGIRAKKTTYKVHDSPEGVTVDSWRFQDWDYKRPDMPTYARGLFTTKNRKGDSEIAVRGYDKFFNVNEVSETKWPSIKAKTQGPYELTLKENGCIIFISGLEDGTLLVCSKHSTGARSDVELSHSMAGEKWINKQLAAIGKTRQDLAQELRKRNITAVAELCDDGFEEHILAYGPDKAGLYLHGININIPQFMTYPSSLVQKFADEWGFRKIGVQVFEDVDTVKTFLEGVAETGAHEGRDVEGFVIRCRMSTDPEKTPYNDWFFKYKFDEPYLMYRQWRECTKAIISGKPPKYKKHVKITEEYLLYARRRLAQDPKLGQLYMQNHGIIPLRDDFLKHKNLKGSDAANMEAEGEGLGSLASEDVVLVPIATIGCGKTTVAVALIHLFGWGHIQNDNIQGKNRPNQMVRQIVQLLCQHPVVIADRNNSERRERDQIIKDVKAQNGNAKLIAMNFAHNDMNEIRRITRERVLKRGDNHQTIQAASDEAKVIGIMENFMQRFQPCNPDSAPDSDFDSIIDLDATQDSRTNLETMVRVLHERYPGLVPDLPSAEDMDEAIKAALEDYKPDLRHKIPDRAGNKKGGAQKGQNQQQQQKQQSQTKTPKKKPLEYMSISVPLKEVKEALEEAFRGTGPEVQKFYKQLMQTRRVQSAFHVTLMHKASAQQHKELWKEYTKISEEVGPGGDWCSTEVEFERVVWDERIMAVVVRIMDPKLKCVNNVAHITIGTRDDSVKPKESNDLLLRWLQEGVKDPIQERVFEGSKVVRGTARPVFSR